MALPRRQNKPTDPKKETARAPGTPGFLGWVEQRASSRVVLDDRRGLDDWHPSLSVSSHDTPTLPDARSHSKTLAALASWRFSPHEGCRRSQAARARATS